MIRLHEPTFGATEIGMIVDVLKSTMVTQGAGVAAFEDAFCPTGANIACNSGSSANLLAVAALVEHGIIEPGDEVAVPALTWPTTIWPLVQYGMVPVFIDCDPDTLNMKPEDAGDLPVVPVHVYGNPCDMEAFAGAVLFEDCCEAMGADVGHNLSTYSFYFSHHLTTVEGGMVHDPSGVLAPVLRSLRSHGWRRDDLDITDSESGMDPRFTFHVAGYNLRMTEIQAAMGLIQLPKLKEFVARRRTAHKAYREALSRFGWLRFQKDNGSSCFGFTMIVEDGPISAGKLRGALESAGIETRPIIAGNMARQPAMKKYRHRTIGDLPNATNVMRHGFSIGCHQEITADDAEYVADCIGKCVR